MRCNWSDSDNVGGGRWTSVTRSCTRGRTRETGRRRILTGVAAVDGGDRCRGGEVQLSVFGEIHGHSRKLKGVEVEAEGVPTCLSTVTHLRWRTAERSGGDPITKNLSTVTHLDDGRRHRAVATRSPKRKKKISTRCTTA
jgi:hypothetical protein